MRAGQYAVIRYIADPARNEPLNIGAIIWDGRDFRVRVDDGAVQRVIRDHPRLTRDALLYVEPKLHKEFQDASQYGTGQLAEVLATQESFPIAFSEPRFTAIAEEGEVGLEANLERLINRIVRPRRRVGGTSFDPTAVLVKRLRPFIRDRLVRANYVFEDSRSGIPRSVDFFANSGANVAVDVVRLALTKSAGIAHRADAEAFKVEDIRLRNPGIQFLVYCHFSSEGDVQQANSAAQRVIESVGAAVTTDVDDTAQRLERALVARSH